MLQLLIIGSCRSGLWFAISLAEKVSNEAVAPAVVAPAAVGGGNGGFMRPGWPAVERGRGRFEPVFGLAVFVEALMQERGVWRSGRRGAGVRVERDHA